MESEKYISQGETSDTDSPQSERSRPLLVLHVVESFGAGVAAALESYREVTIDSVTHEILGFRRVGAQIDRDSEPLRAFVRLPRGKVAQLISIRRHLATTSADVIHAHSSWAGFFSRLARPRGGPPIVYSPHCFAFERTVLTSLGQSIYRWVERRLGRHTDLFAAVGQREAALAKELCPKTPTVIVPHALSTTVRQMLLDIPKRPPATSIVVATVARIAVQKDVDYFLAAKRNLDAASASPDGEVQFVWIGGGDQRLTAKLVRAGVRVTGWLPRSQALQQLAEVDIYVHSAAWEAGWPISLLEAAHARRPIVCRQIGASEGLPAELLVGDPSEMAARLLELRDPLVRTDAVADVVRFVERLPTLDDQANALITAYTTARQHAQHRRTRR
jgi:glycosyltransferase involved in cell wall biosynthesis